ncbi:MAG TPA: dipeptidase PepE [Candidatus Polarisedimenticolia bacterium]|jgi:dipeptidase E
MRLLLLSNSSCHGAGYLDHAAEAIRAFLSRAGRILFVPFALHDQAAYWARVRERFAQWGIEVDRAAEGSSGRAAVEQAEAFFVGGGNTFRLLHHLQGAGFLEPIRRRVAGGAPYLGSSAGTVIAAPTIRTTNDMPIVQPASLDALGLVPFQINCHYLDADPASTHMGETREQRIREFHEENEAVVIGLREGAWLAVEGGSGDRGAPQVLLEGRTGARVFRRGAAPSEFAPGAELTPHLFAK